MAKDPAVLLYTSDFLTGTATMTYDERGKYITLLCLQHQKKFLTEKDIFFVCNENDYAVLEKFKKEKDGFFYNERMKIETIKRSEYCDSRRNNRKKDKTKNTNICKTYDKHMEDVNVNVNIIKNTNTNTEKYIKKFNENSPVKITKLTDARKQMLSEILSKYNEADYDIVMKKIRIHPFLNGTKQGVDWKVTFDWLFKEDNFIKVLEGYENTECKTITKITMIKPKSNE